MRDQDALGDHLVLQPAVALLNISGPDQGLGTFQHHKLPVFFDGGRLNAALVTDLEMNLFGGPVFGRFRDLGYGPGLGLEHVQPDDR